MLVGITGTICAGKHTTAEYLVQHHNFLRLHLPDRSVFHPPNPDDERRFHPTVTDQRGKRGLTFPDVESLLDFVTKRWREHWVLTDIVNQDTLDLLLRRPFFLLISVEAPMSLRYKRFNARCAQRNLSPIALETFMEVSDQRAFGLAAVPPHKDRSGTAAFTLHAHIQVLNSSTTTESYFSMLSTLDLPSSSRLRPPWDAYFMHLAHLASLRSNCMKRRVGCVLIHNNRIISTGYNGTPRGITNCNDGGCPRCNNSGSNSGGVGLSTCLCLHAEENALLEAGRERIRDGSVLYCDTCPCLTCSVKIAQVGVREVVYSQAYSMDDASRRVLTEAGVGLRQYSPPKGGLQGLEDNEATSWQNEEVSQLVVRNGSRNIRG